MSERTVLCQFSQDQRCATKPLDIQVPNLYRDKVLQRLKGTVMVKAEHYRTLSQYRNIILNEIE